MGPLVTHSTGYLVDLWGEHGNFVKSKKCSKHLLLSQPHSHAWKVVSFFSAISCLNAATSCSNYYRYMYFSFEKHSEPFPGNPLPAWETTLKKACHTLCGVYYSMFEFVRQNQDRGIHTDSHDKIANDNINWSTHMHRCTCLLYINESLWMRVQNMVVCGTLLRPDAMSWLTIWVFWGFHFLVN